MVFKDIYGLESRPFIVGTMIHEIIHTTIFHDNRVNRRDANECFSSERHWSPAYTLYLDSVHKSMIRLWGSENCLEADYIDKKWPTLADVTTSRNRLPTFPLYWIFIVFLLIYQYFQFLIKISIILSKFLVFIIKQFYLSSTLQLYNMCEMLSNSNKMHYDLKKQWFILKTMILFTNEMLYNSNMMLYNTSEMLSNSTKMHYDSNFIIRNEIFHKQMKCLLMFKVQKNIYILQFEYDTL